MKDLLYLAKSLEKRVKKLNVSASKLAAKVAEEIITDLIIKNPVDTSLALSNWQISFDNPAQNELQAYYLGKFGSTRALSSRAAINSALYDLATKKPGVKIYISNLTPYIVDLNNGSSMQQPAGFVERAVAIGRIYYRKNKIKF